MRRGPVRRRVPSAKATSSGGAPITKARSTLACGAAILLHASAARAEPAARFIYVRGEGTEACPSEWQVREAVVTRLGYDPFSSYAASTMFAEVTASGTGFTATLKLVDGESVVRGDRQLRVEKSCGHLMEAMSLTISIAIDPSSVTRAGQPPDAPPREKTVETVPETPAPDMPAAEPAPIANPRARSRSALTFWIGLGPVAGVGTAPAPSIGGTVTLEGRTHGLVGGLESRADMSSSSSGERVGRVQSSLAAASIYGGVRSGALFVAAVASAGRLAATSSDVSTVRTTSALVGAAGVRVGFGVGLTERLELRARGELLANLTPHTLEIDGQAAFRYPIASANVAAGLAVRFW